MHHYGYSFLFLLLEESPMEGEMEGALSLPSGMETQLQPLKMFVILGSLS